MAKADKINTWLISGAGNTFHVLDDALVEPSRRTSFVIDLCKKEFADGVVFLQKISDHRYAWDFYNKDGSKAEMCGNAARCVGLYVSQKYRDKKITLYTIAGTISVEELAPGLFRVAMTPFKIFSHHRFFHCNTGVPHIIYPIENFESYQSYLAEARKLRNHSDFKPQGVNVTFVSSTSNPLVFKAVSYERGVEDFTQACGTGAASVALFNWAYHGHLKTTVLMPGGSLTFDLTDSKQPTMIGPALLLKEYNYEA